MSNIWVGGSPESPMSIADERCLCSEVCTKNLGLESKHREGIEILAEYAYRGACANTNVDPDNIARVPVDCSINL
jgi:hypothetical protein